jgi:hypothetical protein
MTIAELLKNFLHDYTQLKRGHVGAKLSSASEFVEIRHTLLRVENCLQNVHPFLEMEANPSNIEPLLNLLRQRWDIISATAEAYPYAPENPINAMYIKLAEDIGKALDKPVYKILMHTLVNTHDSITAEAQENLPLNHYVLSDDRTALLPIASTLTYAEEDGRLKKYNQQTNTVTTLSDNEKSRLIYSSREATQYFNSLNAAYEFQQTNGSIGSLLRFLMNRFTNYGGQDGSEFDSGNVANQGIVSFTYFLTIFTDTEKENLFQTKISPVSNETFGDLWQRISDPNKKIASDGELDVVYCISILASKIDTLLKNNPELDTPLHHLSSNKHKHMQEFLLNREFAKQQLLTKKSTTKKAASLLRKFDQNMLDNLLADAIIADDDRVAVETKMGIPEPYSNLTLDTLRVALAKFSKPARINALKIIGVINVRRVINSNLNFDLILPLISDEQLLQLLKLLGKDHVTQIIGDGYGLISLLAKLPCEDHLSLFELLGDHLKTIFRDFYQFAHLIPTHSKETCENIIQFTGIPHIRSLITSGNDLYIFLGECIAVPEWHKIAILLKSKEMRDVVSDFLAKHLVKMPATSQQAFIQTIGTQYALSLLRTPEQLKNMLSLLPNEEQKTFAAKAAPEQLRNLIIPTENQSKQKCELKVVVKKAIAKIDLFSDTPEMHNQLVRETVAFYATERSKTLGLGMFSSKTKAVKALHQMAQHGLDKEIEKAHKRQLSRDNEVGELFRRVMAF